jgi:hypothetical protein
MPQNTINISGIYDIGISEIHQTICQRLSGSYRNCSFKFDAALLRMQFDKQPQHPKKSDADADSNSNADADADARHDASDRHIVLSGT